MLCNGLQSDKLGLKPSEVDQCVFIRKDAILLTWVDDCIIFSKDLSVINYIVEEDINSGDVSRHLGLIIQRNKDKSFEIKQPYLVERILKLLEIDDKVNAKPTPVSKPLLHKDIDADSRVRSWN